MPERKTGWYDEPAINEAALSLTSCLALSICGHVDVPHDAVERSAVLLGHAALPPSTRAVLLTCSSVTASGSATRYTATTLPGLMDVSVSRL